MCESEGCMNDMQFYSVLHALRETNGTRSTTYRFNNSYEDGEKLIVILYDSCHDGSLLSFASSKFFFVAFYLFLYN